MKHAILLFIVFTASIVRCHEPQSLHGILKRTSQKGLVSLDQGYRGKWTHAFSEDSTGLPFDDSPLEFTHARIATPRDDKNVTLHELVVATNHGTEGTVRTYRAPTQWIKKIPEFDELKTFKTIAEYEAVFGEFRGVTDGWGSMGSDGKNEWHSSLHWRGFVPQESGSIRVVAVFLHTVNEGEGWRIDKRYVREGVFHPTGKAPVLEKAKKQWKGRERWMQKRSPTSLRLRPGSGFRAFSV